MSGSGGGGGGGSGGGGGGGGDGPKPVDCSVLRFRIPLSTPDPKVISTLVLKQTLDVEATKATGPIVAKVRGTKKIAGSITSAHMARLLQCIDEGYGYVAVVVKIDKGLCEVEIRPEGK